MDDDAPSFSPPGYAGRLADGKSAVIHDVRLSLEGDGMRIVGEGGEDHGLWLYDTMRLVEDPNPERPVRLRPVEGDLARLEVADHAILAKLAAVAPDLNRTGARDPAQWRRAAIWAASLVVVFGGIGFVLSQSAPLIATMIPMSVEDRIGRTAVGQVAAIFGGFKSVEELTCGNAAGVAALDSLTAKLKSVDDSPYVFNVRVLDIDIPNALAAPGGHILIFRGLLDMAETPDEVAGVLGHEMGHVIHRHATTNLVRAVGIDALIIPLISGGTMAGDMVSGLGKMALQASYSREAERDADLVAVDMLTRTGIRADSFPGLLLRIEKKYGIEHDDGEESDGGDADADGDADGKGSETSFSLPDILSSHPATPERVAMVAKAAKAGGGPGLTGEDWQALRSICAAAKTDD